MIDVDIEIPDAGEPAIAYPRSAFPVRPVFVVVVPPGGGEEEARTFAVCVDWSAAPDRRRRFSPRRWQGRLRSERPIAIDIGVSASDFHAIAEHGDARIGFRGARKGGLEIVCHAARDQIVLNGANIVRDPRDRRRCGRNGVDDDDEGRRGTARVAKRIGRDHRKRAFALC